MTSWRWWHALTNEGGRRAASELYFAYGSNLDHDDWSAFCLPRGFDPDAMRPVGPAVLPDEILVFDYRSQRRQCGALNIRPQPGGAVDGYLFALPEDGWDALDAKEGHPHRYRREWVRVLDPAGRSVAAQTFRVLPAWRSGFHPPSPRYLAICRAGRARYGLSVAQLETAAAAHPV